MNINALGPKEDFAGMLPQSRSVSEQSQSALNGTRTEYPRNATVSALFEEVAALHAESVALVEGDVQITYAELNRRANHQADRLRRTGVKPDSMVACCFDRSANMIVAFLAVLKAGGAYVPLDPTYPKARLEFILEDIGEPIILAQRSLASSLDARHAARILVVDEESDVLSRSSDDANPPRVAGPTNLAYVMYTSGSTGRPKGVLVENRGIIQIGRAHV